MRSSWVAAASGEQPCYVAPTFCSFSRKVSPLRHRKHDMFVVMPSSSLVARLPRQCAASDSRTTGFFPRSSFDDRMTRTRASDSTMSVHTAVAVSNGHSTISRASSRHSGIAKLRDDGGDSEQVAAPRTGRAGGGNEKDAHRLRCHRSVWRGAVAPDVYLSRFIQTNVASSSKTQVLKGGARCPQRAFLRSLPRQRIVDKPLHLQLHRSG